MDKMSAQNEGRQSPEPERSTGAQQGDAPSDGQGVNDGTNNKEESKSQLEVRQYAEVDMMFMSVAKLTLPFRIFHPIQRDLSTIT
jgi:hypothetical protein